MDFTVKEFYKVAALIHQVSKDSTLRNFASYAVEQDKKLWVVERDLFDLQVEMKKLKEENTFLTRTISEMYAE